MYAKDYSVTVEQIESYIADNQIDVGPAFINDIIDNARIEGVKMNYEDAEEAAHIRHAQGCLCHTATCELCKAFRDGCCPLDFLDERGIKY